MQGSLFTHDFLEEGITETDAWGALDADTVEAFRASLTEIFDRFPVQGAPNEADTERRLIDPVLQALGWDGCFLVQQAAEKRRLHVPDYLLFDGPEAVSRADRERSKTRAYLHGVGIVEAKRWQRPLGRGGEPDLFDDGVPSTQMLRYLSRVEVASERRIQWGVLTNGRHWRLYYQGARSRSEEFLELDLPILAQVPGVGPDLFSVRAEEREHFLRVFLLMFRREAFLPTQEGEQTFHRLALDEGRFWEARVANDLSTVVFEDVFPRLVRALAGNDPDAPHPLTDAYLEEVRVAALTLLYRLLFVLHAEDRNLLPVRDDRYDDYALRRVRESVRDRIDQNDVLSDAQGRYHSDLKDLFNAIQAGDESIGVPPYNGGLFEPTEHPILERVTVPDAAFAPIVDGLSRRVENDELRWINYRDLSVQQLGSIYERLLEYEAVLDPDGEIEIRLNTFARKGSGSYYTHQDLVDLIIRRTVGPLLDERRTEFEAKAKELKSSKRRKADRLSELRQYDPASAFLDLKVCDPAMGSGHFLVSLVDYLADNVLEAIADVEAIVDWADEENSYRSPLVERFAQIRGHIVELAETRGWAVDRDQLDDRHIVRRMILKRTIYGVDKNPMAVELAKVSLWLHTFTVGAPLSFLDHHLRCGDSLFGEWVGPTMRELSERYALLINPYVQQARNAIAGMRHIEELTDADIAEAQTSSETFQAVRADTEPLMRFLDFRQALRWMGIHDLGRNDIPAELIAILDGSFGDPFRVVAGDIALLEDASEEAATEDMFGQTAPQQLFLTATERVDRDTRVDAVRLLREARAIAERERFLHWQVGFPGVWQEWESVTPEGGFDAIIGNPPWDRIKLQEVEWFAARQPEIAHATRASDRRRMIRELGRRDDPLWRRYHAAKDEAVTMAQVARKSDDYPLLSGGDINIYSLFVERGHSLIGRHGLVGHLVPSGIASDLGASKFFRGIATSGRLAALFDFENKRVFFPDVDSRFKFCTYVAGGEERRFGAADCAFYLHDVRELADPERRFALSAEDFARINPNTGTAPVFRTRRDAELTTAVYTRLPVLVDRRSDPPTKVWPVRFLRMFDMTNDAGLFRTRQELEMDGFYLTDGNHFRRGEQECLPLYEGKMVQAFDHRAASIVVNLENVNRPAQPEPATSEQHSDPTWFPTPQFWVRRSTMLREVTAITYDENGSESDSVRTAPEWFLGFKHVTAPTNVRTMIVGIIPESAVGNSFPLLLPDIPKPPYRDASIDEWNAFAGAVSENLQSYIKFAPLLVGNLNAFAYDYFIRGKVHGQNLNYFIIEQLPLIPPDAFQRRFGQGVAADMIRREVLRLTYTAHDMTPFARDMGYDGPPFEWDEEDRRHRRARLDALFFHLYGIGRDDVAYILDTFPIVKRDDETAFGRYLTKELILAYMNAVEAGDFDTVVSV